MRGIAGPATWMFAISALSALSSGAAAEDWVELQTPHFILSSNADPRTARNVALEFEQARALFRDAIGSDVDTALPITIFAVRASDDLRVLLPGLSGELPLGVFLRSPDRHRIAVRLDESTSQRFHTVYHEYHHLLLRSAVGHTPVWLAEGLAEFWSHMEQRRDGSVEIGRPSPRHLATLRSGPRIPLQQLLRFRGDVHELPMERIATVYAQSWAVVHYLMLGKGAGGREMLERYTERVGRGEDPLDTFEEMYGSAAATQRAVSEYLDQTMFPAMRVDLPVPPAASEFSVRELPESEVEAGRGRFIATGPWPEKARAHLERALELDPGSHIAMEGMGFLLFRERDYEAAATWFEKAASAEGTSYLAHYYLGMLAKEGGRAPADVEANFKRAIELNPKFAPAYVDLSSHLARDEGRLDEALTLAEEATRLAPDIAQAWENLAVVLERMGRAEESQRARERANLAR